MDFFAFLRWIFGRSAFVANQDSALHIVTPGPDFV
jgi:hypothetical protein